MSKTSGFTLIELLVVIAIIGILAAIGYSTYSGIQASARDARRKEEVDAISKVWESKYNFEKGTYPAYNTIVDSDFASGKKPMELSDGTDYYNQLSSDNKAFVVCTNKLEKESQAYCRYSSNGSSASIASLPTPIPAPVPTATPTTAPTTAPTPTATPTAVPTATPTPRPFKYAFITHDAIAANFGGLTQADGICNSIAGSKGLPTTFKAWLSDQSTDAGSRLSHATLPYQNIDGSTVASDWTDLTNGGLSGPFKDESGQALTVSPPIWVWTNTYPPGNKTGSPACNSWTSNSNSTVTTVGDGYAGVYQYSAWTSATTRDCSISARLYCLEQ